MHFQQWQKIGREMDSRILFMKISYVIIWSCICVLGVKSAPKIGELREYCDPDPPLGTPAEIYSYYPYKIGWMREGTKEHSIKGDIYIIDKYRFKIQNFTYDGTAPGTYVLAMKKGTKGIHSSGGYMLALSGLNQVGELKYSCTNLADSAYQYGNLSLIVSLPAGQYPNVTTMDIRALAVYSYEFCINFRSKEFGEVSPGPAYDFKVGEITPFCDVKEAAHKKLVHELKECHEFNAICNQAPHLNVYFSQFLVCFMTVLIVQIL